MRQTKLAFVAGVSGLFLFLTGTGMAWFGTQSLIKMWAWEKLTLKNHSEAMKRWMRPPLPISMKVYFFNVTNPENVSQGALPVLAEVGPYVYEQIREKVNIMQLDNFTLSYQLRNIIKFKPNHSGRLKESDLVTIINVPLAVSIFGFDTSVWVVDLPFKKTSKRLQVNLVGAVLTIHETVPEFVGLLEDNWRLLYPGQRNIFITTSVREILFDGITIDCTSRVTEVYIACRGLDSGNSHTIRREGKNFKFSFFHSKNGTSSETFQIYQGIHDLTKSAQFISMNYSASLKVWKNEYCDMINGSDGTQFPVMLNKTQKLYIFEKELCRSVYVEFEKEIIKNGVPLYKFVNTGSLFASPNENPDNGCFCRSPLSLKDLVRDESENNNEHTQEYLKICFQNGVLPMMPCIEAPITVSFPHFYLGDQNYIHYSGLTPTKDLHETFLLVEPISGTSVMGFKRIQYNLEVRRIPDVQITSNLVDGLFPILWVEEEMQLSPELFKLLKYTLITKKVLVNGTYVVIILGLMLIVTACVTHLLGKKLDCSKGTRARTAVEAGDSQPNQEKVKGCLGVRRSSKKTAFPSGPTDLNFLQ